MSDALQLNLFGEAVPAETKKPSRKQSSTLQQTPKSAIITPVDEEPPKDRPWVVCYAGHRITFEPKSLEEIRQELERDFPELSKERVVWHWVKPEPPGDGQEGQEAIEGQANGQQAEPEPLIIVPVVTAGKKGLEESPVRGFHWSAGDMLADPRPVHVLAARDGLYEVRKTPVGIFSRRLDEAPFLDEWGEGFQLNFPPIPVPLLASVVGFFQEQLPAEAVAYICWNKKGYYLAVYPRQQATPFGVDFKRPVPGDFPETVIPVLEIHSHGNAPAYFSKTDDEDELATGLYAVVGRVGTVPEIRVRYSCGGVYREVDPGLVFDFQDGHGMVNAG